MPVLALLVAVAFSANPAPLKTVGDWIVGCDNGRVCQSVALVPAGEDRGAYLLLVVSRDAEAGAPALLAFHAEAKGVPGAHYGLRVDGKPAAEFVVATANLDVQVPLVPKLTAMLANGKRATLVDARGHVVAAASLSGLAAALLYVDDVQHRLGTVTALRRPGARPEGEVPAPPVLPVIIEPARDPAPPRTLSVAAATRLIGTSNARCDFPNAGPVSPQPYRLDAAHSLVIVPHPCGNGAYNGFSSVYVLDQKGRATPAEYDAVLGMGGADRNDELVNGAWDTKTRRLRDFAKGRGVGDCGSTQAFAWDGARFRLVEQTDMSECSGSIDFITTWRARVVTR